MYEPNDRKRTLEEDGGIYDPQKRYRPDGTLEPVAVPTLMHQAQIPVAGGYYAAPPQQQQQQQHIPVAGGYYAPPPGYPNYQQGATFYGQPQPTSFESTPVQSSPIQGVYGVAAPQQQQQFAGYVQQQQAQPPRSNAPPTAAGYYAPQSSLIPQASLIPQTSLIPQSVVYGQQPVYGAQYGGYVQQPSIQPPSTPPYGYSAPPASLIQPVQQTPPPPVPKEEFKRGDDNDRMKRDNYGSNRGGYDGYGGRDRDDNRGGRDDNRGGRDDNRGNRDSYGGRDRNNDRDSYGGGNRDRDNNRGGDRDNYGGGNRDNNRGGDRDNYGGGNRNRDNNRGGGDRDNYGNRDNNRGGGDRDDRDRNYNSRERETSLVVTTSTLVTNSPTIRSPTTTTTTTTADNSSDPLGGGIGFVKRVRDEDATDITDGKKQIDYHKSGKSRSSIKLATNQFLLNADKSIKIWQYSVSFNPTIYNRAKKYDIISSLTDKGIGFNIYDGSGSLYCLKQNQEEQNYQIDDITIRVQLIKALDPSSTIQFYNIFMKKVMKLLGFSIVGRQYYNSRLSERIESSNLNVWPGFFTSINRISAGVALLADMSRKVIRKESVLSLIRDKRNRNDIENELIGSIVITLYNNKTYRINSIEWSKSPRTTFSTDNGDISFEKYYKITYDRSVTDMDQPLLISRCKGRKEDVFLIPEFCNLTGIPDEDRKNFNKMKDINDRTVVEPRKRFHGLSEFISSINSSPEIREDARRWGISFQSSLEVTANQFSVPSKEETKNERINCSWGILAPQNLNREIDAIEDEMRRFCNDRPIVISVGGGGRPNGRDYSNAVKDITNDNPKIGFLVVIIPNVQTEIYNAIKRTAILDCKVITQVITARVISGNKFRTIFGKIVNQINSKIGRAPWRLSHPTQGIPKDVMIVGIDVGHNTQKDARSVAAFCATTNASFTNVYVSATIQKQSTKEVINSLGSSMGNALKAYHKINSRLPETVIVYRDGVSDGMIDQVNKFEVQCIRESFTMLPSSMGAKPKLIYIIVKKNTHLRFFDLGGNYSNPNQGVVISQGVTKEHWYDFFLISQKTTKGTANPTHYHVIQDETNIQPEALQQLTYNLCFLYFNFDQSISVPNVCQFSHKAALLVGKSCNANTPEELSNRLFFL